MSDETKKILTMLADGKITTEEAEKLLNAVEKNEEKINTDQEKTRSSGCKFLYVQVEPKEGKSSDRVSVKVPFALLKAGLNIVGLIPAEAQEKINTSLADKGMSFNLNDIKPENLQEILTALEDLTVDIDDDDSTVKVFCK